MKTLHLARTCFATVLAIAGVLATVAAPASAVFVETPLTLATAAGKVNVGDDVTFNVKPANETHQRAWAGKGVRVHFSYDQNERSADENMANGTPDDAVNNAGWTEGVILPDLRLDRNATATFSWTVPEDVRDHNVIVTVRGSDGETLATAHVAVGSAPPVMYATGGNADDGREVDPITTSGPDETAPRSVDASADARTLAVAGLGVVGVVVAGMVVVGIARRP